jgi:hypothetical protein
MGVKMFAAQHAQLLAVRHALMAVDRNARPPAATTVKIVVALIVMKLAILSVHLVVADLTVRKLAVINVKMFAAQIALPAAV